MSSTEHNIEEMSPFILPELVKLLPLLKLQNELNTDILGFGWKNVTTYNGVNVNWFRYIMMEAAEALESLPYKHWKKQTEDIDNLKVEIVDIMHFIFSSMLKELELTDIVVILKDNFIKVLKKKKYTEKLEYDIQVLLEHIINISSWHSINTAIETDVVDYKDPDGAYSILNYVALIMVKIDMSLEELHIMYLTKNVLNKFRLDNGYKTGEYVKVIDGKEDNVHIIKLYADGDTFDTLYNKYERFYKNNR